jgi:hypothetical protein
MRNGNNSVVQKVSVLGPSEKNKVGCSCTKEILK